MIFILIALLALVLASGRQRPRHHGDRGGGGGGGGGDFPRHRVKPGHLGTDEFPVKAVYLGYSSGVSSIANTIRTAVDAGFNLINLAFWMGPSTGVDPYSAAYYWSLLSASDRSSTIEYAHSHGANVIVSAGGAGYNAYPSGGGTAFGQGAAQFALNNSLDGVDFDFENFTTAFGTPLSGLNKQQTIQWMLDANSAARALLGSSRFITHAPQSPYFNVEFSYGYRDFYLSSSPTPSVDLFLIQYYNQGATYLNYDSQFINNDNFHPGTAVAQLITTGFPANKIVIGRLTQPGDGSANSWIDPATLGQWFTTAKTDSRTHNWTTGFSTWQWHAQGDGSPSSPQFVAAVYP